MWETGLRLALVTQDFPPQLGGIQTYSWELSRHLARRLSGCIVLAPGLVGLDRDQAEAARQLDASAAAEGVRVVRCGRGPDVLPMAAASKLARLALRGEIDVAFHSQWQTLPAAAALRRTGRLRGLFAAVHGRELLLRPLAKVAPLQAGYDRVRRALLQATDQLFPVSRFTGSLLAAEGLSSDRYTVVSNGTDPAHFAPRKTDSLRRSLGLEDRLVLLFAGRLVPNKGVDTVLRALPALLATHPRLAFVIVGAGPDRARLEALAKQLGVHHACRFVGRVSFEDLPRYHSLADLFVTLSRQAPPAVEGFGLVFLEAGACGTAVIGTASGGIPDAIIDGQTGQLVPPDDPGAFAEVASALLADPDRRAAFGAAGRRHVLSHGTWDVTCERLLAAMGQALS